MSTGSSKVICLAVDDEPPALDILVKYIQSVPSLELAGTCINAVQALDVLRRRNVDLMFLDIQMPQLLGTDLMRTLTNPPKVIFTTAFRKFAVEGFELNAVDYLLKPISFERFLKAVNKVMDIKPVQAQADTFDSYLYFRSDRKMHKVPVKEIVFIESLKDYIKVVTTSKTIITKQSISSVEERLPKSLFIRIHRSFIVALDKVQSYTPELIAIGNEELPVSRMYRHEVEKVLK
ncbi:MAG: response regulator transcription factor [Chitinophagaceae bacterium]|nr:response regulator transcription factor [Chitinophagaceae bacterium]